MRGKRWIPYSFHTPFNIQPTPWQIPRHWKAPYWKAIHSCILGCIYLGPGIPFVFVPRFLHFPKSLHPSVEGILGVDTKIERIKRYGVKALRREGQGSELRAQSSKLQASSIYLVRREARNVNKRRKRERTDTAQIRLDRLGGNEGVEVARMSRNFSGDRYFTLYRATATATASDDVSRKMFHI